MEDELYEVQEPELSEELDYAFTLREILKKILTDWKQLELKIIDNTWCEDDLNEFNKLLNYFYE